MGAAQERGSHGDVGTEQQANEGEGNRTATREYNEAQAEFAQSGKVKPAAGDAAVAVDGPEAEELGATEQKGRLRSHGEDPR